MCEHEKGARVDGFDIMLAQALLRRRLGILHSTENYLVSFIELTSRSPMRTEMAGASRQGPPRNRRSDRLPTAGRCPIGPSEEELHQLQQEEEER